MTNQPQTDPLTMCVQIVANRLASQTNAAEVPGETMGDKLAAISTMVLERINVMTMADFRDHYTNGVKAAAASTPKAPAPVKTTTQQTVKLPAALTNQAA